MRPHTRLHVWHKSGRPSLTRFLSGPQARCPCLDLVDMRRPRHLYVRVVDVDPPHTQSPQRQPAPPPSCTVLLGVRRPSGRSRDTGWGPPPRVAECSQCTRCSCCQTWVVVVELGDNPRGTTLGSTCDQEPETSPQGEEARRCLEGVRAELHWGCPEREGGGQQKGGSLPQRAGWRAALPAWPRGGAGPQSKTCSLAPCREGRTDVSESKRVE